MFLLRIFFFKVCVPVFRTIFSSLDSITCSFAMFLFLIDYNVCIQGVLYGSVGFVCGIIGQGIANTIMNAKRYVSPNFLLIFIFLL